MTFTRTCSRRELVAEIVKDMHESLGIFDVPLMSRPFVARQVAAKAVQRTLDAVDSGGVEVNNEMGRFVLRRGREKGLRTWVANMVGAGAGAFIALKQGEKC